MTTVGRVDGCCCRQIMSQGDERLDRYRRLGTLDQLHGPAEMNSVSRILDQKAIYLMEHICCSS